MSFDPQTRVAGCAERRWFVEARMLMDRSDSFKLVFEVHADFLNKLAPSQPKSEEIACAYQ